jgi:hypothetical protein
MLSRYQNASAASREYCKAISGKTPFWASGEMDRTGLKILENNKNIQSIISVNTNILLRRFRLKFLRIMCSTSYYKERVNFENTLYYVYEVLSRPSKSERFFYSLIFTLNHRRPKMSKFDTSDKKFIETIFF